jgi:hypothetical protein
MTVCLHLLRRLRPFPPPSTGRLASLDVLRAEVGVGPPGADPDCEDLDSAVTDGGGGWRPRQVRTARPLGRVQHAHRRPAANARAPCFAPPRTFRLALRGRRRSAKRRDAGRSESKPS